jgi:hypothetical protein
MILFFHEAIKNKKIIKRGNKNILRKNTNTVPLITFSEVYT